ncbi:MAG TPA: circadian clock KaiB family protein [Opitutus sp.]|nr:circadian clock KaiB family protein [Opitutus sp.]
MIKSKSKPVARPLRAASTVPRLSLWELRLYVAGQTPKSLAAFANLTRICDQHLSGRYRIEIVDLSRNPALAHKDQIVALPTLIRKLPMPIRRVVGDLSNVERVLIGMELRPSGAS